MTILQEIRLYVRELAKKKKKHEKKYKTKQKLLKHLFEGSKHDMNNVCKLYFRSIPFDTHMYSFVFLPCLSYSVLCKPGD